jgi:DNA modification methylase
MRTTLSFEYGHRDSLPEGHRDEVRTCDVLVEHFVEELTDPGDRVLDIFAGYGTTLLAAERLGRTPYGIEFEDDRTAYVRDRLADDNAENVRHGDVLEMEAAWFTACDLCFTSPPFMAESHTENPFENYAGESSYPNYLDDVERAFRNLDRVLAPDGHVVVDVSNLKNEGEVTTLAWDVAERIREVFQFEGETVVCWTDDEAHTRDGDFGYGYDHSYALHFTKRSD